MTVLNIKSAWKWKINIIFQMLIGKSVTHFNEINKCSVVLTSWISSITSKISWIVGWPWSNHLCVCVWVCVAKTNIGIFFVWKFGFRPGEVMEKSWNFFLRFCGNPALRFDPKGAIYNICQHWFRWWLDTTLATNHYLNQWWPNLVMHICFTWPQWIKWDKDMDE